MPAKAVKRITRSAPVPLVHARTTVFRVERPDISNQIAYTDEFGALTVGSPIGQVALATPYPVWNLFRLIDESNMLRQCIDAYVTNTVQTGWEVRPVSQGVIPNSTEQNELQSFIDHANSEETLQTVMEKVIRDREYVGFGFLEIIRDISDEVSILRHAPSKWTRLCPRHAAPVLVQYDIRRGMRTSSVQEYRRFRRFCQIVNGKTVYFKEFGDPRKMDYMTGSFEGESNYNPLNQATEIYHFKNPSNDPYGVPRWISQLPSIIGSREAEEVNMRYFQDNTVPPMMLTVSNGRLTQASYRELNRMLNEDGIGRSRQNRIMLIEAIGEGDSMDGKAGNVDLKVEKLADTRQSDGLFKGYDDANQQKIRSSFRMPPVVVGMSQDVNFATAQTSVAVAESQVFQPARSAVDEVLNKQIIQGRRGLQLKTVKLVSRTPSITSPDMVIKALTALNVMGAVTPRSAQLVANTLLQMELPLYPEEGDPNYEKWMDQPISFTRASPGGVVLQDPAEADLLPGATPPDEPTDGTETPAATHGEQALKTPDIKALEKTGNLNAVPKHGQE